MMLLNLLVRLKPHKIYLAGLDGYSVESDNYYKNSLNIYQDSERMSALNKAICCKISSVQKTMNLEFVTPSIYNQ